MPIVYKFDVPARLREAGFTSYKIRQKNLLAQGVLQSLREGKSISFDNLGRVCALLGCQPGDILEYVADDPQQPDNNG